jgi:ribosomal protein S18 acetylase RimI-like enzyme
MDSKLSIRRAETWEAQVLADSLAQSFQADPVSCWIFPDPDDRAQRQPQFFRIFVDVALGEGRAYTTDDYEGVALWLDIDPWNPSGPHHLEPLLQDTCGPNYQRFCVLDQALYRTHPRPQRHAYLPFIGVNPRHQGRGIGTTLLGQHLARLDALHLPAYLEASSVRSRALYERHGFRQLPGCIELPNGPTLWPMWRSAEHSSGLLLPTPPAPTTPGRVPLPR